MCWVSQLPVHGDQVKKSKEPNDPAKSTMGAYMWLAQSSFKQWEPDACRDTQTEISVIEFSC